MAVLVLVVLVMMSQWCSLSEAQLNVVDAAALFDLCDRPGIDLWPNCSDSANACINTANWPGINCDTNKTAIVQMYDCLVCLILPEPPQRSYPLDNVSEIAVVKALLEDYFQRRLGI